MKRYFSSVLLGLICMSLCFASGDDPVPVAEPQPEEDGGGWVYGKIEYRHDLRTPQEYFMLLRAHPGQPVPLITGGYATTDVYAVVRLRGVDTPRALQHSEDRNRPHDWLSEERARWDAAMVYLWNIIAPTRLLRVHGLAVVERQAEQRGKGKQPVGSLPYPSGDGILEGDLEIWLGGQWLNLGYLLMNDGHARPEQPDGTQWDWGVSTVPLLNSNLPK